MNKKGAVFGQLLFVLHNVVRLANMTGIYPLSVLYCFRIIIDFEE